MTKPAIMGAAMGAMMLWMLHGLLTGSGVTGLALIVFVGAHFAVALILIGAAVFTARLSPRTKAMIDKLHRPTLRHVGIMLTAALITATAIHLTIHGGLS